MHENNILIKKLNKELFLYARRLGQDKTKDFQFERLNFDADGMQALQQVDELALPPELAAFFQITIAVVNAKYVLKVTLNDTLQFSDFLATTTEIYPLNISPLAKNENSNTQYSQEEYWLPLSLHCIICAFLWCTSHERE